MIVRLLMAVAERVVPLLMVAVGLAARPPMAVAVHGVHPLTVVVARGS